MRKHKLYAASILLLAVLILSLPAIFPRNTLRINDKVLRLHIIANSDSAADQALKQAVRDRIISEISDDFKSAHSLTETKDIAAHKLNEIETAAADEIRMRGKSYPVKAELGSFAFPLKAYGNMVFPPGEYSALRVVIGDGRGANWWCVLFPPLCFVDLTHGTVVGAEAELKKVLTDKEIAELKKTESGEQPVPIVRFKVLEWAKGITTHIAGAKTAK